MNPRVTDRHSRFEWAEVVRHIAEDIYPNAGKPTLIQDNLCLPPARFMAEHCRNRTRCADTAGSQAQSRGQRGYGTTGCRMV
ncbi:MAG TPA: hypothetical protein DCQ37_10745 [Desulfobacteraceae bacterium]|nr:hypothetical protein [Desulfobacteraceae bacterium]